MLFKRKLLDLLFKVSEKFGDEIDELKLVMRDSGHHGMITFDQCMFKMYKEGKISYDDALRHADSANEVRLMIKLDEGGDAETLAKGLEGVEVLGDRF